MQDVLECLAGQEGKEVEEEGQYNFSPLGKCIPVKI